MIQTSSLRANLLAPNRKANRYMAQDPGKRHATIYLRRTLLDQVVEPRLQRFLAKGTMQSSVGQQEGLNLVLRGLGHEPVSTGLAALRFWGQTGDRPTTWIAGADPVHLETLIAGLRLHTFLADDVADRELQQLFDDLQNVLGDSGGLGFARIGSNGYLCGDGSLSTAGQSAESVNGESVAAHMPGSDSSGRFHRLLGEMQMLMHEHPVNVAREANGARPVNSLWLWGGGHAAEKTVRPIAPLFSADPLFRGYWESCTGTIFEWRGEFAECLESAVSDFVLVPDSNTARPEMAATNRLLDEARRHLVAGRIRYLSVLFADGHTVHLRRRDLLRFWRGVSADKRSGAKDA